MYIYIYIRDRKIEVSIIFITQSYFKAPKYIRLNSSTYFNMKVPNEETFRTLFSIIVQALILRNFLKNVGSR